MYIYIVYVPFSLFLNCFAKKKHFLLRPDLIDEVMERSVALMQSVVEAGRYIRDVKVVPIKVRVHKVL